MESTRGLMELDTEEVALLPSREVMAVFNVALVHVINASAAVNFGTLGSLAESAAVQDISVAHG